MDFRQLARNAGSAERARSRLQREGFAFGGRRLWTDEERQALVKHDQNYDLLCNLLPHRTRAAIKKEAYNLRPKSLIRYWTAAEVSKLRKIYPSVPAEEICVQFPWTDWFHIRQVAQYHGFRRRRKAYKLTGIEALDAVRRRCFEIGWSIPPGHHSLTNGGRHEIVCGLEFGLKVLFNLHRVSDHGSTGLCRPTCAVF